MAFHVFECYAVITWIFKNDLIFSWIKGAYCAVILLRVDHEIHAYFLNVRVYDMHKKTGTTLV